MAGLNGMGVWDGEHCPRCGKLIDELRPTRTTFKFAAYRCDCGLVLKVTSARVRVEYWQIARHDGDPLQAEKGVAYTRAGMVEKAVERITP